MKSPKTYVIVLLALATIGGGTLAWNQYQELIELRAQVMNKDERADLQKRIWDLEKANRDLADSLAAARTDGDMDGLAAADAPEENRGERGGRGGRGEGGRGGRGNNNPVQQAINQLRSTPEALAIAATQRKMEVERQYAALFKNLNLSPEQAEKLKSILADRRNTLDDARSLAREQGLSREDSRKLFDQTQADIAASIKSVIGEAGYAQMQTFEQTMPQRNLVRDLAERLSYTSTPLTSQQQEGLIAILAANQPQRTVQDANQGGRRGGGGGGNGGGGGAGPGTGGGGGPAGGGGFGGGGFGGGGGGRGGADLGALAGAFFGGGGGGGFNAPTISPAAVSQSQSILSAPQVTALQQLQQQQQAQKQLQQTVRTTLQQLVPPQVQTGTGTGGARGGRGGRGGG